jgi:hypothetical protein
MIGSLSRMLLLATVALLFAAPAMARKKKDKDPSVEPAAVEQSTPDVPDDANSKKFASSLIKTAIENFTPSDASGATFKYAKMTFSGDNQWTADAFVEIQDERMECVERGGWTLEPAESASVGTVSWKVEQTDCPGREAGSTTRAEFTISKSGVDAVFR